MNLTFLSKTDKELQALRDQQDSEGKEARKEIQRRKLVGFCDGTAIERIDPNAKFEEVESKVGQVTLNGVVQ